MNSYGVTHRLLRPARLPISPPPRNLYTVYIISYAKSSKLNINIYSGFFLDKKNNLFGKNIKKY